MDVQIELLTADSPLLATVLGWHLHEWSPDPTGDRAAWGERLRSRCLQDDIPFTLLATLAGEAAGCLTVCHDDVDTRFSDRGPWLSGMLVIGAARNLGVGRALVTEVAARAQTLGATELWLHTSEASRFYERCGYRLAHPKESLRDDAVLWRELD